MKRSVLQPPSRWVEVGSGRCSFKAPSFPDKLPLVIGRRVQLQQVLLNLVMNAIEAMSSVNGRERELTILAGQIDDQNLEVIVEDTGCGIDPVDYERIFNTLFTTKQHGMGMGLFICRSIIEAHGGRLWALPRSPFGTAFHFTLPLDLQAT